MCCSSFFVLANANNEESGDLSEKRNLHLIIGAPLAGTEYKRIYIYIYMCVLLTKLSALKKM